jgi:hypothetical protein
MALPFFMHLLNSNKQNAKHFVAKISLTYKTMLLIVKTENEFLINQLRFFRRRNHGYETPKQALETNSKARCGELNTCLCGIIRLTNFKSLRF